MVRINSENNSYNMNNLAPVLRSTEKEISLWKKVTAVVFILGAFITPALAISQKVNKQVTTEANAVTEKISSLQQLEALFSNTCPFPQDMHRTEAVGTFIKNKENMEIDQKEYQSQLNVLKLKLAYRIAGQSKAPRESIESIFQGMMNYLDARPEFGINGVIKEKIWNIVSPPRIKILQDLLLQKFSEIILKDYNENDIEDMLTEHIQTGRIYNPMYTEIISNRFTLYKDEIVDTIVEHAKSMNQDLIEEISKYFPEVNLVLLFNQTKFMNS